MTKPRTLSHAIRRDIAERLGADDTITVHHFAALAESFGKPIRSVNHILRDMVKNGLLEVVGEQTNRNGGSGIKYYAVVPGAQLTPKTPAEWLRDARQREASLVRSADNLQRALDRMTRTRVAA